MGRPPSTVSSSPGGGGTKRVTPLWYPEGAVGPSTSRGRLVRLRLSRQRPARGRASDATIPSMAPEGTLSGDVLHPRTLNEAVTGELPLTGDTETGGSVT